MKVIYEGMKNSKYSVEYWDTNTFKKCYYSNCIFEAIRAKIMFRNIKILYIPPSLNEVFCPHFFWTDGIYEYEFRTDKKMKWYQVFWFEGYVKKHNVGCVRNYIEKRINEI